MNLNKLLSNLDNPRKYVQNVHTFLQWAAQPYSKREKRVPYWLTPWYILPQGLEVKSGDFNGGDSEFKKLDKYLAKRYPLQYFLRDGYRDTIIRKALKSFQWDMEELYNDVKCWLFPRRPKLKAAIPNTYADLTTIIPNVLFAAIVEYVEDEKCFEIVSWKETPQDKKNARKIKEIYKWVKTGKKELEDKMWASYPPLGCKLPYKEAYKEQNRLEKKLEAQNTRYLTWIVQNRGILWT